MFLQQVDLCGSRAARDGAQGTVPSDLSHHDTLGCSIDPHLLGEHHGARALGLSWTSAWRCRDRKSAGDAFFKLSILSIKSVRPQNVALLRCAVAGGTRRTFWLKSCKGRHEYKNKNEKR
ncbi:unnamed protein product [Hapterophycus canaliculatus]